MIYRTWLFSVIFYVLSLISASSNEPFPDELLVRVDRDGRHLTLLSDFRFIDEAMRTWTAPAGTVVDGASIPRPLWSLIGGPLEGKYREASVIHDYYCVTKNRPWDQVHQVFYDAMLANGVSIAQATLMYLAVYRFGPRWDLDYTFYCTPGWHCAVGEERKYHIDDFTPPFDGEQSQEIVNTVKSFNFSGYSKLREEINIYKVGLDDHVRDDAEEYLAQRYRPVLLPDGRVLLPRHGRGR
jgi:Protein of unknown function (DUF1353)